MNYYLITCSVNGYMGVFRHLVFVSESFPSHVEIFGRLAEDCIGQYKVTNTTWAITNVYKFVDKKEYFAFLGYEIEYSV